MKTATKQNAARGNRSRDFHLGYSLVEILIAAGILAMVVAAAAGLSGGLTLQEDLAQRTAVAMNYQEQAARMWQMGIEPGVIVAILPPNGDVQSIVFDPVTDTTLADGGQSITVRQAACTMTFQIPGTPEPRTETLTVVRPIPAF